VLRPRGGTNFDKEKPLTSRRNREVPISAYLREIGGNGNLPISILALASTRIRLLATPTKQPYRSAVMYRVVSLEKPL
jgi:hypothetical protein